jgi:tetratricopeptide (TPR) repeat protein
MNEREKLKYSGNRLGVRPRELGKLNASVAFKTILVLLALSGSIWALHRFQLRRVIANLETEANEKLSAKNYAAAVPLLQRLIAIQPPRNREIVELADAHSQMYPDQEARLPQVVERQIAYDAAALNAIEFDPKLKDRSLQIKRRLVEKNLQSSRLDSAFRLLASMAGNEPDPWVQKKASELMFSYRLTGVKSPPAYQNELPAWFVKLQSQHPVDLLLAYYASDPSDIEVASILVNIATQLGSTKVMDGSAWASLSSNALIAEAERIVDVLVDSAPGEASLLLRASLASRTPIQRKQDLEKVLEINPNRIDALRGLVQIQIDARRSKNGDPSLLLDKAAVDSMFNQIDLIASKDRSQDILQRGWWIARVESQKHATDFWEDQLKQVDRPIFILKAMMEVALEQRDQGRAKQILQRMRDSIEAQQQLETESEKRQSSWTLSEAESRIAYEDGNIEMATKLLEKAGFQGSIANAKIQLLRMAEGYRSMGLHEKALDAIQRASRIDPTDARITRMMADQHAIAGRLPEAINSLQAIEPKGPQDELAIAQMLLELARQSGVKAVDWNLFQQSCLRAKSLSPESTSSTEAWRVDLLELTANWIRHQGGLDKLGAEIVLSQARMISDSNSTSLNCQEALIDNLTQWLPETDVQPFVDQIALINPDHPRVLINRFNEGLKEGRPEAVVDLELAYQKNPDARIQNRLVLHAASLGKWDDIDRYVLADTTRGASRQKDLVRVCELLLDNPPGKSFMEGAKGRENARKKWLELIQKYDEMLESQDTGYGFNWRWIRLRRLFEKGTLQSSELKEVTDLLSRIEELRPNWDGLFALRGRLSEARGDFERAIDSYSIAWNRNSLPDQWASRYLVLLGREGRDAELRQVAEKMNLLGMAASLPNEAVAQGNAAAEADQMIEEMIRQSPSDPSGHLLKYRVLMARAKSLQGDQRRQQEKVADEELAAAARISGDTDPGVFSAQIQRAQEKGDIPVVYSLMDRVLAASTIPAAKRFSLVGASYVSMGKLKEAIQAFQKAVEAGGPRLELISRIADCAAILGDVQLALSSYRQLAIDYPNNLFFKQRLVQFLAFLDRPETWTEIRKILQVEDLQGGDDSRYQFSLLALNYGNIAQVDEAIQLLEGGSLVSNPESPSQILLARLTIRKAKAMFLDGAPGDKIEPLYQSAATRLLESKGQDAEALQAGVYLFSAVMAEKRYEMADSFCNRLGRIPGAFAEVIACQARLARARGAGAGQATAIIDSSGSSLSDLPQTSAEMDEAVLLARAHLLVGDAAKGERFLRKICELKPLFINVYAIAIGATEDQAIQTTGRDYLASLVEKSSDYQALGGLVTFHTRTTKFDQELSQLIELIEKKSLDLNGEESLKIQLALADLLWSKGRASEAASAIEGCLQISPLDAFLVNNYAMILADTNGRISEALELAKRYVPDDIFEFHEWQDTLGCILRASGQTQAAIDILKSACTKSNSPRIRLHLAIALLNSGDQPSAIRLADGIVESELRLELLSPSDREAWEDLQKLLPGAQL